MKELIGVVVSNSGLQTAVVKIDRLVVHPKYKKRFVRSKKIKSHDTLGVKVGDMVKIIETRPISKEKSFRVSEVIKSGNSSK